MFRSNTANSVAPPRRSIVLPTRAAALPAGISSPRTHPTPLLPTSPPFTETLRRVTIPSSIVGLPPPTSQRNRRRRLPRSPTPIGYGSSLKSPRSVPVSASSCVTTFAKRICRSGSRSRISRRSLVSRRVPWLLVHLVETPRLLGRRRWNATTKR